MALFGIRAKQWRDINPKTEGNIRDAATIEQLVVISNLESIHSVMIHQGHAQSERCNDEKRLYKLPSGNLWLCGNVS